MFGWRGSHLRDAGGSPSFQVIHLSSLLIADSECLCEARVAMVAGGSWSNMLTGLNILRKAGTLVPAYFLLNWIFR